MQIQIILRSGMANSINMQLMTNFDENCMNAEIMKTKFYDLKCHFHVMKKFCDYFLL